MVFVAAPHLGKIMGLIRNGLRVSWGGGAVPFRMTLGQCPLKPQLSPATATSHSGGWPGAGQLAPQTLCFSAEPVPGQGATALGEQEKNQSSILVCPGPLPGASCRGGPGVPGGPRPGVGCPSRLALRSCPLPVSGVAPLTRRERRNVTSVLTVRAPGLSRFINSGWGGLASRGSKAVYVCNLTGLPLSSLIEKALFICFDTNAFSVLS